MEEVARRVYAEERAKDEERIERVMYEIARAAYEQAVKDFLGALDYDVESITRIGFDGCRDIFEDRKAQKYISDHIMKEIQKRLNGKNYRKYAAAYHVQRNNKRAQTIPRESKKIVCAFTYTYYYT